MEEVKKTRVNLEIFGADLVFGKESNTHYLVELFARTTNSLLGPRFAANGVNLSKPRRVGPDKGLDSLYRLGPGPDRYWPRSVQLADGLDEGVMTTSPAVG